MQYSIPKSKRWSEDKLASYIFVHYSKDFKNLSFMIYLTLKITDPHLLVMEIK